MSELVFDLVSEFSDSVPNVPFAPDVDVAGILADDSNPFFVSLPILKIGATSRNGLKWDQPAVERVVQQINEKKPEGGLGHITIEERSHKHTLPVIRWVGATIVGETAYAKGYVPKYAQDVRDYFKNARAVGAKVGTSVYGLRSPVNGLHGFNLESLDLGAPDRVALPEATAIPYITSEMEQENVYAEDSYPLQNSLAHVPAIHLKSFLTNKVKQREMIKQMSESIINMGPREAELRQTVLNYAKQDNTPLSEILEYLGDLNDALDLPLENVSEMEINQKHAAAVAEFNQSAALIQRGFTPEMIAEMRAEQRETDKLLNPNKVISELLAEGKRLDDPEIVAAARRIMGI